jgi:hypothetical protein
VRLKSAYVLALAAILGGCQAASPPPQMSVQPASPGRAVGPPRALTGAGSSVAPLDFERHARVGDEVASSDGMVLYYQGALDDGTLKFREAVAPDEFKSVTFDPRASTYYPFGRFDIEIYSHTPTTLDYTIRPAD